MPARNGRHNGSPFIFQGAPQRQTVPGSASAPGASGCAPAPALGKPPALRPQTFEIDPRGRVSVRPRPPARRAYGSESRRAPRDQGETAPIFLEGGALSEPLLSELYSSPSRKPARRPTRRRVGSTSRRPSPLKPLPKPNRSSRKCFQAGRSLKIDSH